MIHTIMMTVPSKSLNAAFDFFDENGDNLAADQLIEMPWTTFIRQTEAGPPMTWVDLNDQKPEVGEVVDIWITADYFGPVRWPNMTWDGTQFTGFHGPPPFPPTHFMRVTAPTGQQGL